MLSEAAHTSLCNEMIIYADMVHDEGLLDMLHSKWRQEPSIDMIQGESE
jgi:hypothetical protein